MKLNQTDNNDEQQEGCVTNTFPALYRRDEFVRLVSELQPGQSFIYHIGNIAYDRQDSTVAAVADAARVLGFPRDCLVQVDDYAATEASNEQLFGLGVGHLTQRRLKGDPTGRTGAVEYIFTKR